MLLLTCLLLEVVTRVFWRTDQALTIFNRQIMLLPLPLATPEQIKILAEWSKDTGTYLQFDPVLGWSIRPNVTAEWEGHTYTSNSIGLRSLREYSLVAPEGVTRIAAFGPSFTHGDEVQGYETWEAQLEQVRPDLEVMNWGVGGYGTDQAFLRYKTQGVAYRPDIVIIGFEEENISRNVNRFRSFYRPGTGLPLTKPLFITDTTGLALLGNPFQTFDDFYQTLLHEPELFIDKICPADLFCDERFYHSQPFDFLASFRFFRTLSAEIDSQRQAVAPIRQERAAQITFLIVQMFIRDIIQNQAVPLVVVFPEQATMANYEHGVLPPYHTGVVVLRDNGIQVIDLAGVFAEAKRTQQLQYQDFFASEGGHFNARGNQVVAQAILWHLCSQGLLKNCS